MLDEISAHVSSVTDGKATRVGRRFELSTEISGISHITDVNIEFNRVRDFVDDDGLVWDECQVFASVSFRHESFLSTSDAANVIKFQSDAVALAKEINKVFGHRKVFYRYM